VQNKLDLGTKLIAHTVYTREANPAVLQAQQDQISAQVIEFRTRVLHAMQKYVRTLPRGSNIWTDRDTALFDESLAARLPKVATGQMVLPDVNDLVDLVEEVAEAIVTTKIYESFQQLSRAAAAAAPPAMAPPAMAPPAVAAPAAAAAAAPVPTQEDLAVQTIVAITQDVRNRTEQGNFVQLQFGDVRLGDLQYHQTYMEPLLRQILQGLARSLIRISPRIQTAMQQLEMAMIDHFHTANQRAGVTPPPQTLASGIEIDAVEPIGASFWPSFLSRKTPKPTTVTQELIKYLLEFYRYSTCAGERLEQTLYQTGFRPLKNPTTDGERKITRAHELVSQVSLKVLDRLRSEKKFESKGKDVCTTKRPTLAPNTAAEIHLKLLQPLIDSALEFIETGDDSMFLDFGEGLSDRHLRASFQGLIQAGLSTSETYRLLRLLFVSMSPYAPETPR